MKHWKKVAIGLGVAVMLALVLPLAVSAATAQEALLGLKEVLSFYLGLAEKGLEAYKAFLQAIP